MEIKMKQLRSRATTNSIYDQAFVLFIKKGYHGTGLREIAEAVEISTGGIYAHFQNKEQIFVQLLQKKIPFSNLAKLIEKYAALPVEEFFLTVASEWVKTFTVDDLRLIFIDWLEFEGKHLKTYFYEVLSEELMQAEKFIKYKIHTGEIHKSDPLLILKTFIQTVIINAVTHSLTNGSQQLKKEELRQVLALFTNGILAKA